MTPSNENPRIDPQDQSGENRIISETITRQYSTPQLFFFESVRGVYRKHKSGFWVVLLVGLFASVVTGLIMPKAYTGSVFMIVRQSETSSSALTAVLGAASDPGNEVSMRLSSTDLVRQFIAKNKVLDQLKDCPLVPILTNCPTNLEEAVIYFTKVVLRVQPGLIADTFEVDVTWIDPQSAARWANGLVGLLNRQMQDNEIRVRTAEVNSYRAQLLRESSQTVQQAIYANLVQSENALTLARSRSDDYAVTVVDPAVPPIIGGHQAFLKVVVACAAISVLLAFLSLYFFERYPAQEPKQIFGAWSGRNKPGQPGWMAKLAKAVSRRNGS